MKLQKGHKEFLIWLLEHDDMITEDEPIIRRLEQILVTRIYGQAQRIYLNYLRDTYKEEYKMKLGTYEKTDKRAT